MKTKKVIDYTNDITKVLNHHHATLTTKLAYVLALTISQDPEVRTSIITKAIRDEFNFLFDYPKRKFSDDFKQTLRTVLIEALTHNYDETQAKMHVYGFTLEKIPHGEMRILQKHLLMHFKKQTMPERSAIPELSKLVEEIEAFQDKFTAIEQFEKRNAWEITYYAITNASFYGIPKDGYNTYLWFTGGFILFGIIQLGCALAYHGSPVADEQDSNANLITGLILFDIIAMIAIHQMTNNLKQINKDRKLSALQRNTDGLSSILPKLITREIKVNDTISYTYSLPLFEETQPKIINNTPSYDPDEKFKPRPAPEKLKSRPSFPIRLFEGVIHPEQAHPPFNQKQNDEVMVDGVTYRRMYNEAGSTKKFVGYTEAALTKHTTPANKETFKALLDAPRIVPPKNRQGFVKSKTKGSTSELANFKLKYHGDTRLLFTHVKEQPLGDESIKLYLLSASKTHQQIARKKR